MDNFEHVKDKIARLETHRDRVCAVTTQLIQTRTQDAVATAFANQYEGRWIHAHGGGWFQWTGKHWASDTTKQIPRKIRELARESNPYGKAANASAHFFYGVRKLLEADPVISRQFQEFDRNANLLCCPDAVYDLRDGSRRNHDPDLLMTQITAVPLGGDTPTRFVRFMDEIADIDSSLVEFLQMALGSCLSGAQEVHQLFYFYGATARNGKNTLADLIAFLLGDSATSFPAEALLHNRFHDSDICTLKGKRIAISSEVPDGSRCNEMRLKNLTSDTMLTARPMYGQWQEFPRTHKHIILGNHRPALNTMDQGVTSKFLLVPFKVSFKGREDFDLPQKLKAEGPDILGWLLKGHLKWRKNGMRLPPCKAVEEATNDYFESQATVDMWVEERCQHVDNEHCVGRDKANDLYQDYKNWKLDRGEQPMSLTRWGEHMAPSFRKVKANGVRYIGVLLKVNGSWLSLLLLGVEHLVTLT